MSSAYDHTAVVSDYVYFATELAEGRAVGPQWSHISWFGVNYPKVPPAYQVESDCRSLPSA